MFRRVQPTHVSHGVVHQDAHRQCLWSDAVERKLQERYWRLAQTLSQVHIRPVAEDCAFGRAGRRWGMTATCGVVVPLPSRSRLVRLQLTLAIVRKCLHRFLQLLTRRVHFSPMRYAGSALHEHRRIFPDDLAPDIRIRSGNLLSSGDVTGTRVASAVARCCFRSRLERAVHSRGGPCYAFVDAR